MPLPRTSIPRTKICEAWPQQMSDDSPVLRNIRPCPHQKTLVPENRDEAFHGGRYCLCVCRKLSMELQHKMRVRLRLRSLATAKTEGPPQYHSRNTVHRTGRQGRRNLIHLSLCLRKTEGGQSSPL